MNQVCVQEINLEELILALCKFFNSELEQNKVVNPKVESIYLNRTEVTKLLKISLPSLTEYTKRGLLQSYKIGNRVLYKSNEIEQAIDNLKTYKHKKVT
jgi:hypothetical protein